jgi:Tfp pilus assembly protein PilP
MRYAIISFSLLLLSGCADTDIIGCPDVPQWMDKDQTALLKEITRPGFKEQYPETYRALEEYQDMRVTAKPCALLSRPVPH